MGGRKINRVAVALSVLSLTAMACAASAQRPAAGGEGATGGSSPPRLERTVAVYASVIRQLVTKDHGYGGADPGFRGVYVINGVVEGAEDPGSFVEPKPEKPFARQVKRGLRKALDDVPPIKFVNDLSSVLPGKPQSFGRYCSTHPASCRVINNGVLLTLGPIQGDTGRVEVGNSLWINLQAGRWGTYVLERRRGGWEVTGTTGPEVVS